MAGHTDTIAALKAHTIAHHEGGVMAWCAPNALDHVRTSEDLRGYWVLGQGGTHSHQGSTRSAV